MGRSLGCLMKPRIAFLLVAEVTVCALFACTRGQPSPDRDVPAPTDAAMTRPSIGSVTTRDPIPNIPPLPTTPTSLPARRLPDDQALRLVHFANVFGEVDVSSCRANPSGGLAARTTLVRHLRAEGDPLLLFDAGDQFTSRVTVGPSDRALIEARARLTFAALQAMGTTAVNVGGRDLVVGVSLLRSLAKRHRVPLIATNLTDASGRPVFETSRIVRVAGLDVAVLGVVPPRVLNDRDIPDRAELKALDPASAVAAEVAKLAPKRPDLVIVLSRLNQTEEARLLEQVTAISFVLGGADVANQPLPLESGGRFAFDCSLHGREACVTTLLFARRPMGTIAQADPVQALRGTFARAVSDYDTARKTLDEMQVTGRGLRGEAAALTARLEALRAAAERVRTDLARLDGEVPRSGPVASFDMHPVRGTLDQDPAVRKLVSDFKAQYHQP